MRYLPLLWAGLFRKKTRTILTLLSIVVAFALFGLLQAVQVAFESGADTADAKRLLTTARYSIIEPLPMGMEAMRCRPVHEDRQDKEHDAKQRGDGKAQIGFGVDTECKPRCQQDPRKRRDDGQVDDDGKFHPRNSAAVRSGAGGRPTLVWQAVTVRFHGASQI